MTKRPETSIDSLPQPASPRPQTRDDVIHLAIRLVLLALIVYWCFLLVQPFIAILAWSIILAVALYPAYDWLVARIGGRRKIAAVIITLLSIAIIAGPVVWLGSGVVESAADAISKLAAGTLLIVPPPEEVKSWPLVGDAVYDYWALASTNLKGAVGEVAPYATKYAGVILAAVGGVGAGVLQFLAALFVAGFLFAPAPRMLDAGKRFLLRLVPERSDEFIVLAGMTIRSVSQGVIGISVVQAVLAGIGLKLVGIPSAGLLAILIMISCILQIGAFIILVPAIAWVWFTKDTTAALIFTVYIVPVGFLDSILKPIVMGRGLNVPTVVILLGVIGGTLVHGVLGLFVGPVVLAVGWSLLTAWFSASNEAPEASTPEGADGSAAADEGMRVR